MIIVLLPLFVKMFWFSFCLARYTLRKNDKAFPGSHEVMADFVFSARAHGKTPWIAYQYVPEASVWKSK